MDKFGYIRGRRGPPGPSGKDAIQLHEWCPKGVLEMFRRDQECTFYFNTETDGILYKDDKPIGLKDRFGENNAICLKNFHAPVKIRRFHALPLQDTLYKISRLRTATAPPSICVIALQFKITAEKDGYIIANEANNRGVVISKKSLNILGTDPLGLEYQERRWNKLIIQYSNMPEGDSKCFFVLNGRRGFFIAHPNPADTTEFYIGGHPKGKDFASLMLTNLDIYYKHYRPPPDSYFLPEEMIKVMEFDMTDREY